MLKRNPWILPILIVVGVAALYLAIVTSRSSVDQSELLGHWFTYGAIFVGIALAAVFAYKAFRHDRDRDEGASLRDRGR
ncbi:MAG TPA: hypothetical protein VGU24_05590 [Microvirga sp.]|jgi:hypothetical protein|nr:hypothetical protein [Microvirga sp.]